MNLVTFVSEFSRDTLIIPAVNISIKPDDLSGLVTHGFFIVNLIIVHLIQEPQIISTINLRFTLFTFAGDRIIFFLYTSHARRHHHVLSTHLTLIMI